MAIISTFLKVFISIVLSIATFVAPAQTAGMTDANAPLDSENCKLNFVTVSDTHVKDGIEGVLKDFMFEVTMTDMEKAEEKLDALVIAGDITDHGYPEQWQYTEELLGRYDVADRILLAMGNHDTWTRDDEGSRTAKGLFMEYNRKITGKLVGNVYYSTKINGYPFIVLCSEADNTSAYISDKQINWLKSEMKKASKSDKPIFVISHWPLNKTHGLPVSWGDEDYDDMTGGFGEQSDRINKILQKYDNVFLISGHIHNGFSNAETKSELGYETIEKVGNIYSVNLPPLNGFSENGSQLPGYGYNIEVYDDEVVFRARNYMTGSWAPRYNYTIELS